MKVFRPIFVFSLFLLTVFTYLGHGMHDYFDQVADTIENTSSGKGAQGSIHQEFPQDDESHSILPGNPYLIADMNCQRLTTPGSFVLPKISFTIWLPPELS
jgi:hypothetical protein